MLGSIPAPVDAFSAYWASWTAAQIAEGAGADRWYWGNPNRERDQFVQTKDELLYDKVRFVPERFQRLWHKLFPLRSRYWGVYLEV